MKTGYFNSFEIKIALEIHDASSTISATLSIFETSRPHILKKFVDPTRARSFGARRGPSSADHRPHPDRLAVVETEVAETIRPDLILV
jgi:hypothetical protein